MSSNPITESEVKQFISEWFRQLDKHPSINDMLPFVAEELTVETLEKKDQPQPFKDWYDGVAKFRGHITRRDHKVTEIKTSPDRATAEVIVLWERSGSKSPSPNWQHPGLHTQTLTLERLPQDSGLRIVEYNVAYLPEEVHHRPERFLSELGLCYSNGYKIQNEKLQLDTLDIPIPDEKWLTLTKNIRDLQDLKILADKIFADYNCCHNWQDVFKDNTILSLVDKYKENKKAEIKIDSVCLSVKEILEREQYNAEWDNVMALFSSIAYFDEVKITEFLKEFGIQEKDILLINNTETDTQGFLFRFTTDDGKTIVVHTWRGTKLMSIANWRTNVDVGRPLSNESTFFIHQGIRKALEDEKEKILTFLNKESDTDTINVLTGHSLGGGLANASVPILVDGEQTVARLTTFGAENSISRQGVESLSGKITHGAISWISHSDPVPHLLSSLDVIGEVFYFNNSEGPEKIKNEAPDWGEITSEFIKLRFKDNPVSHHHMDCYLFKTRHLAAYLKHNLNDRKELPYYYRYPYPK